MKREQFEKSQEVKQKVTIIRNLIVDKRRDINRTPDSTKESSIEFEASVHDEKSHHGQEKRKES